MQPSEHTTRCGGAPDLESRADAPSGELPAPEPELFERARDAVQALRGRGRVADGRATARNALALKDGLRSVQLQNRPDIQACQRERVSVITADLGGPEAVSAVAAERHVRLELAEESLWGDVEATGFSTGKGRTRAKTTLWLALVDRLQKSAQALGLERRAQDVSRVSLDTWRQENQT